MRKDVLKLSVASLFFIGVGVYGQEKDTTTTEEKIDEVIVVGYGKSTKAKLTDNVAKISSESLKEVPNANFQNAMVGKAAGVEIKPNQRKLESSCILMYEVLQVLVQAPVRYILLMESQWLIMMSQPTEHQ